MEQDADSPPTLWFQPPSTTTNRHRRPPINPVVLIILLPVLLLLLLFFFLPPLLSHIPKTIKPTSLKFTWDLLNVFLVIFAILCGVFAPRNNNVSTTADPINLVKNLVQEDYEYREKVQVDGEWRSSTWYPDLRQELVWEKEENSMRFSDYFGVDLQYSLPVNNRLGGKEWGNESIDRSETVSGDICHRAPGNEAEEALSRVEGSMVEPSKVPDSVVEPPASAPPLSVKLRRRRTSRSLRRDETVNVTSPSDEVHEVSDTSLPVKSEHRLHMKHNILEREVREATTEMETTIAITSLDDQRKPKTRNIQPLIPSIQPPPPPPSRFHNIYKKEIKHNGIHSAPAAQPPPPPPPPPRSIFSNLFKSSGKSRRYHSSKTAPLPPPAPPPPPPPPPSSFINIFTKTVTKSKRLDSSPAAKTPPPPPQRPITTVTLKQESKRKSYIQSPSLASAPKSESPQPPYKMPATKLELREAVDLPSTIMDGRDSFGPNPISFPSPDVNAKAESFISRCKTEWRMEKVNSIKDKVGPSSSTIPK